MKLKKISIATAVAASAVSMQALATCPAGALCEADANGVACTGSLPVGVVVDAAIRDEMQTASFPASNICNPANANYAAFADTRTCMPSLSSAEVTALAQGNIGSWTAVTGNVDNVSVCGTSASLYTGQAALNFISNGGNVAVPSTSEASVGDVESCMTAVPGKKGGAGTRSIGFLPVDTTPTSDYNFIKLDSQAPILAEHASANYNLIANVNGGTFGTTVQSFGVVGGDTAANGAPTKNVAGTCLDSAPASANTAITVD